jgi:hypothetical protein
MQPIRMAAALKFEVFLASEKFNIALPPNLSNPALLELYADEIEKKVRTLVPAYGGYAVNRQRSSNLFRVWVRQGTYSGFSVNVRSISTSSAEVTIRGSSKAEARVFDFIAIPGLVCSFATFFVLWLGLLGQGFIFRGFRVAAFAAFLVFVASLALAFALKSVIMAIVHSFHQNEFNGDRLRTIVNNLKAVPVPTSVSVSAGSAGSEGPARL